MCQVAAADINLVVQIGSSILYVKWVKLTSLVSFDTKYYILKLLFKKKIRMWEINASCLTSEVNTV